MLQSLSPPKRKAAQQRHDQRACHLVSLYQMRASLSIASCSSLFLPFYPLCISPSPPRSLNKHCPCLRLPDTNIVLRLSALLVRALCFPQRQRGCQCAKVSLRYKTIRRFCAVLYPHRCQRDHATLYAHHEWTLSPSAGVLRAGVLRFKSHFKRKTNTPNTGKRWARWKKETDWNVIGSVRYFTHISYSRQRLYFWKNRSPQPWNKV